MSFPRSSPSTTLQSSDSSPNNFIVALQSLIADKLSGDVEETTKSSQQQLFNFIKGLSTDILSKFSYGDGVEWQSIKNNVQVVELSLEVIQRVIPRAKGMFFGQVGSVKDLFTRLVVVCNALDLFAMEEVEEMGESQVEAQDWIEPKVLRDKAVQTIVDILRCLGSEFPVGWRTEDSQRKVLRTLLEEMITTCEELIRPTVLTDPPFTIDLFSEPRFQTTNLVEDENNTTSKISVVNATELPRITSLFIEIIMKTLHPPLLSDWFLCDLNRRATEFLYATFDHCMASYPPTIPIIPKVLARIVSTIPLPSEPPMKELAIPQTVQRLPTRLLRFRLSTGLGGDWDPVDAYFDRAISQSMFWLPTKSEFLEIFRCLCSEPPMDGDSSSTEDHSHHYQKIAASYVNMCLSRFDIDTIISVKEIVLSANIGNAFREEIMKTIQRRCGESTQANNNATAAVLSVPWRIRLVTLAGLILKPDVIDWMDDDDGARFTRRVLMDVAERLRRPLACSLTVALQTLQDISPCLTNCDGLTTILFCREVATLVLSKHVKQASAEERKQLFKVISSLLRRHTHPNPEMDIKFIETVLVKGLTDRERGVRLNAGISAAAFIKLFDGTSENIWAQLDVFFSYLYPLAAATSPGVLETLVVAVGRMTSNSHQDILGQSLCFLITLLSHKNLAVRGNAYIQIVTAAKNHKISTYTLLLPHFDKIAPYLISKICTDRTLLTEACKLLTMVPSDFIVVTLPRTLPVIFCNRDRKVLDALAEEINLKPSVILLKHAHEVLAHVFLMPNAGQTDEALDFVVQTLRASSGSGSINTQSVVKSCVVPLLAEIVTRLGHENSQKVDEALVALKKVGAILGPTSNPGSGPAGFLLFYILGIISTINDMLQDVHGKKTVERKREILRSIGVVVEQIGQEVGRVAPQIMATFQTMASIPELSEATLHSWHRFLLLLTTEAIGPYIGLTSAVLVSCWPNLPAAARIIAKESLRYIVVDLGNEPDLSKHIVDIVDIPSEIPELLPIRKQLLGLQGSPTPRVILSRILRRSKTENHAMVVQGLRELKDFMTKTHSGFIRGLSSGATFDTLIGEVLVTLLNAASREADDGDAIRLLSFECLSILGAIDMDRCEVKSEDSDIIVISNFEDSEENEDFIKHLISEVVVKAFRSTSDLKYQSHLAFTMQELLRILGGPNSLKVNRWVKSLRKDVMETITPLLRARYTLNQPSSLELVNPIYPTQSTYREWIQIWATHLISMVSGKAIPIFSVFRSAMRNKDVTVAYRLLPHLILNILSSKNEQNIEKIRLELRAVLEDQVDTTSTSTPQKRLLSAQAIFMILDHLNRWVRRTRLAVSGKKDSRRSAASDQTLQMSVIDSVLGSIDHELMGQAALQCRAYARSLMNFEMHILKVSTLKGDPTQADLAPFYEKLHEIYAYLDEPDGMEGISTMILSPSLEHQIRHHEMNGRWTSAQSCWEVRIQQEPNNVEFHMGLLRCLRNLGHYDSLRTHIRGIVTKQPSWQSPLAGFQLESAWMVGDWQEIETIVKSDDNKEPFIAMARLLLALRSKDDSSLAEALSDARLVLGAPVAAAGVQGYRRAYEAVLNLHLTHELEMIYRTMNHSDGETLEQLSQLLEARLEATLPTFHTREAILVLRRTAFTLFNSPMDSHPTSEVGRSWLASAKIARKAGQWQTAYSAILQAQQNHAQFVFLESSRLTKAEGEPLSALRQLEDAMKLLGIFNKEKISAGEEVVSAKAHLLRARWMDESERFDVGTVFTAFSVATELQPMWESGHFYIGRFQDQNWKNLPHVEKASSRGLKMNHYTVKSYAKAIKLGSKYVYQTVPRLLTLWLDLGEDERSASQDLFKKINAVVSEAIKETPMYKWFTAFPQLVSRLEHRNGLVRSTLFNLIGSVIREFPKQALWLFASVLGSKNSKRRAYGKHILDKLRNEPSLSRLIELLEKLTHQLLNLCTYYIPDKMDKDKSLSMGKIFPDLYDLGRSDLLVPLQESLTASLPPTSSAESTHQPFPSDAPTFNGFKEQIEIMSSLARPRKLTLRGSDGQIYMFLAKPKDDLRKDARLMDLYSVINKLLKGNSDSRRRQLHIRTYGVATLNEECGLIQWVPNTMPLRPILTKSYASRGISLFSDEINALFRKLGSAETDAKAAKMFENNILTKYPPVFHEWFIETFPEPTTWLTSRLNYGRTAAVMSMIGFIIGLGDRHCENILLDENSGDIVHVDFNCLFEAGKKLGIPETVPFRLTQNVVDGLGVMGVEGIFRTACEITLQLLRDNRDLLMSILDAFIHDPLVDFEEQIRKDERREKRKYKDGTDLKKLARDALDPIEKKLQGLASTVSKEQHAYDKEISTSNLVQMLIQESMDNKNLSRMYIGWSPHI